MRVQHLTGIVFPDFLSVARKQGYQFNNYSGCRLVISFATTWVICVGSYLCWVVVAVPTMASAYGLTIPEPPRDSTAQIDDTKIQNTMDTMADSRIMQPEPAT